MIEILLPSQTEKKTDYKMHDKIIKSDKKYSYLPIELIEISDDKLDLHEYYKKIQKLLTYLQSLFELTSFIKRKELQILKEQSEQYCTIPNTNTNIRITGKEKDFNIEMVHGKEILTKCKEFLKYEFCPSWFTNWISEKQKSIDNLKSYSDNNDKYFYSNIKELDIYRFICSDLLPKFKWEFSKYFTTSNFFSNTGKACLTLENELYNYFIGNMKGFIPNCDESPFYRTEYIKDYYSQVIRDIKNLKQLITESIPFINSSLSAQNIISEAELSVLKKEFFSKHNLPSNFFIYLENIKLIKKNSFNRYDIKNRHKRIIITACCDRNTEASPPYNLYIELFSNIPSTTKQKYKLNKTKDKNVLCKARFLVDEIYKG